MHTHKNSMLHFGESFTLNCNFDIIVMVRNEKQRISKVITIHLQNAGLQNVLLPDLINPSYL